MALDFDKSKIEVRYASTDYGPFTFDFQDALPGTTTISSVTLKSFLGKLDQNDDLGDQTETTAELIDAVKTAVSGNYGVAAYFNYPSTTTNQNANHTLVFELTLSNGAVHAYYFQRVYVTNQGS
jgi:hypothetical protein